MLKARLWVGVYSRGAVFSSSIEAYLRRGWLFEDLQYSLLLQTTLKMLPRFYHPREQSFVHFLLSLLNCIHHMPFLSAHPLRSRKVY